MDVFSFQPRRNYAWEWRDNGWRELLETRQIQVSEVQKLLPSPRYRSDKVEIFTILGPLRKVGSRALFASLFKIWALHEKLRLVSCVCKNGKDVLVVIRDIFSWKHKKCSNFFKKGDMGLKIRFFTSWFFRTFLKKFSIFWLVGSGTKFWSFLEVALDSAREP